MSFFVPQVNAAVLGIHSNSAALLYSKIRQVITHYLEQEATEIFDGQVELDESYFSDVRKGKHGRGGGGKVVVFGILKRGCKVYARL